MNPILSPKRIRGTCFSVSVYAAAAGERRKAGPYETIHTARPTNHEHGAIASSMITPWKVHMEIEWLFVRPWQNSRRAGNPGYANLGLL